MSVLIKGMEMPQNCWWCPVKFWNGAEYICPFSHKHINSGDADRHDDCVLVPVPDHGDLVDRDVVERLAVRVWMRNSDGNDAMDELIGKIRNEVPSVIPAERSEDGET